MAIWYCGSSKWTAVTAWAALTAYTVGALRRQLAAVAAGSERVFRCTTAGTSGAVEPTWVLTNGATTNDGTAVWTEVTGSSTYNTPNNFAAPHARLRTLLQAKTASTWCDAGDTVYVSNNHAATEAAAVTYTSPGTVASIVKVLCINDALATATLTTGATESTTGANALGFGVGYGYVYGLRFNSGDAANTASLTINSGAAAFSWRFDACNLCIANTSASSIIAICTSNSFAEEIVLNNTILTFGSTSQTVRLRGPLIWRNTANAIGGSVPTILFSPGSQSTCAPVWIRCRNVDLSAAGSGKALVNAAISIPTLAEFLNCKLGASVVLVTGSNVGPGACEAIAINCDSAATNYVYQRSIYQGDVTQETTIVRTGGANDGTRAYSRKLVSSAGASFISPLEGAWYYFWNDDTSATITAAIEVVTDGVTLTDAEAWVEVEAMTDAGFPIGGVATDRAADVLATPVAQTTSTNTWTTTGLASPIKQVLSTTIAPLQKGWVRCRVLLAKASTTMYACPKVQAASPRQYMTPSGDIVNAVRTLIVGPGTPSVQAFGGEAMTFGGG